MNHELMLEKKQDMLDKYVELHHCQCGEKAVLEVIIDREGFISPVVVWCHCEGNGVPCHTYTRIPDWDEIEGYVQVNAN